MKKIWGSFILSLARFLEVLIGGIINILELIVNIVSSIGKTILTLLALLACGGTIFIIPLIIILPFAGLFSTILGIIAFFIFVPFLGRKFVSWLEYINYSAVEFLRNYGDYLINNKENYKSYGEFSKAYNEKKEREEREREEKSRKENIFWEEIFRNFGTGSTFYYRTYNMSEEEFRNQFGGRQQGYGNYNQNYGQYGQTYTNPLDDFKKKYKDSCSLLEIPENTNIYEVKTAYRKMAKKYHPDINKSSEATEMFQKINSAYEFLTEENIQRYNQLMKN